MADERIDRDLENQAGDTSWDPTDSELEADDGVQHGLDDDPNNDAEKGAAIGGVGGAVVGGIAGAALGPGGAIVGAVIGGVAGALGSGAAVAAVDNMDNDNTVTGLGDGQTPDTDLADTDTAAAPYLTSPADATMADPTYGAAMTGAVGSSIASGANSYVGDERDRTDTVTVAEDIESDIENVTSAGGSGLGTDIDSADTTSTSTTGLSGDVYDPNRERMDRDIDTNVPGTNRLDRGTNSDVLGSGGPDQITDTNATIGSDRLAGSDRTGVSDQLGSDRLSGYSDTQGPSERADFFDADVNPERNLAPDEGELAVAGRRDEMLDDLDDDLIEDDLDSDTEDIDRFNNETGRGI